ncbi:hypothetical protein V5799_026029 [Amblyomma americanum]|uniref:Uncharacterized protein n=1 Tax=Amblyomma americanum TaxID=6943 RepID=A0AAQ4DJR6_AMBAM
MVGSALQRESVATLIRERLMAALVPSGVCGSQEAEEAVAAKGAVHPPSDAMPLITSQLPRFTGFSRVQTPEEFFERLENRHRRRQKTRSGRAGRTRW